MHNDNNLFNNLNNSKTSLLFKIRYLFGLNQDANEYLKLYFDLKDENDNTNFQIDIHKLQEILVDFVLKNKYLTNYRPYFKYRKSFLKSIINIIENSNNEVNEYIFNEYINLINNNNENDNSEPTSEKYFLVAFSKSNCDKDDRPIIIEQFASIIANGTTGLHVWPACFQLMEYFYENEHLIENKSILELGSGVGLLGFMCLKFKQLKSYKFSDSHNLVLKQIETNLKLNNTNGNFVFGNQLENISIERIDWTDLNDDFLNGKEQLDLIIATDIIFDPDLMPHLIKTLNLIWSASNNPLSLCFYVSSTIRNQSTYDAFIKNLDENGFCYDSMQKKSSITKSSTPDCLIEILKITKKREYPIIKH